ncbi:MAG: portal protein [Longimicrobiales bacterium]
MPDAREFKARLDKLKAQRMNFDTLWQEVQELVWPDGDQFLRQDARGSKKTQYVYEMSAANALEKFASAMESFLTPRFSRWHGLRATDDNLMKEKEVKEFFETVTNTLFKNRNSPQARFYGQMHEYQKSLGAYGNGCLYVDEAASGRGVRYKYTPVGRCWIEVDHQNIVDTLYYEYPLSAKAAAQKWPHAVPPRAALAIDQGNVFQEHEYLHVVMPNSDLDPERKDAGGMPFRGSDISVADDETIPTPGGEEFAGFHEFPYLWGRYTLNPAERYGRGPAMLVLPDIQTLQEMEKTFIRSGHKVADPPLLVAHDGRMGRGRRQIRLTPGGLNYGAIDESGRPKIQPLQTGARLDMTKEMMDQKRDAIDDVFLVKIFDIMARDRVEMTATEVLERAKEKGQLITPVVGRQQAELLGPLITREIGVLQRQGVLPPVPPALAEADGAYEIEYESTATRMQGSDEVAAYQRLVEVFSVQANVNPEILDVFKAEDAIRDFGETLGIRPSLFMSPKEMKALREAEAQAAQEAAAVEQAQGMAGAARDAEAAGVI